MEEILLRDPAVQPTKEVLKKALGSSYPVYEELFEILNEPAFSLVPVWNYYNDGKAWLCKVCYKKKTVFWLSIWENYFKTTFYYTEKNCGGIMDIEIDEIIKVNFKNHKPVGKFMPLTMAIDSKEQIKDLLKIVEYKKSLK